MKWLRDPLSHRQLAYWGVGWALLFIVVMPWLLKVLPYASIEGEVQVSSVVVILVVVPGFTLLLGVLALIAVRRLTTGRS